VPELEAHNIFLAEHYKESFDSIFKKHLIPDEPSFYVNVPSRVDPTAAPPDTDSVVVLVPVGHLIDPPASTAAAAAALAPTPTQDWPAMVALARRTILSTIAARTGVDLTPHIVHEQTNDPATWRDGFHLDRGAILGLSHSFFNVLCFRPSTRARRPGFLDARLRRWGVLGRAGEVLLDAWRDVRGTRDVRGLYMVGASAHPGTGVPICLAGGKLVAEQICGDYGVEVPWRKVDVKRVRGDGDAGGLDLDRIERPVWLDSWEQWMGIFGGLVVVVVVMIMMMVR
jgi:phytoene desaturase (3,4-didehydrolycopene-forming)